MCRRMRGRMSLFGGDEHEHAFSLEFRHLFWLAVFKQSLGELEKLGFALFFVEDGAAFEEDVDLDLVALLEEADGMVEFELEIMVIGLWTETDFLDNHLA